MSVWRNPWAWAGSVLVAGAVASAGVYWLNVRGEAFEAPASSEASERPDVPAVPGGAAVKGSSGGPMSTSAVSAPSAQQIERGAYLSRAGNCMGCHTPQGGSPFAGGRRIDTPFGVVVAPNITPDATTGIGRWTASDFWRALHHGRSKDGRFLNPAFPYPSFTWVTREDSDALWAYLRSVPAVQRPNEPHELRFPYGTQAALAVWRALNFQPATFQADPQQTQDWNRGRYLVQGLGHCAACHSERNALGGIRSDGEWSGGLMPDGAWYAPSLADPHEAGIQHLSRAQVVSLLQQGVTQGSSVSGPMAEVVFSSTQYMTAADLGAMADYLTTLPVRASRAGSATRAKSDTQGTSAGQGFKRATPEVLQRGGKLYGEHCASCHGASGEGVAGQYPALAGNRAVTLGVINNLVQMIRHGGFAPATMGNPRPFGMPPFAQALNEQQIADVATYLRQSWGNEAEPVSSLDVLQVH